MKTRIILASAIAVFSLNSCKQAEKIASTENATADVALEKFFTDEEIPDAKSVHEARTTAKPGEKISLKGDLIGRVKIFVDGRAAFVLGDPTKLTSCNKKPGDGCETPWDACCDSNELKRTSTASIQIVGEDGRVLSGNIKGTKGLKELSSVTLTGVVDENSTEENLIVNASEIRVEKK